MRSLGFTFFSYTEKGYTERGLRNEIEHLIHAHQGTNTKPTITLLTGDQDFSATLASLRLEGFSRVLLVHAAGLGRECVELASKAITWENIRYFASHTIPHSINGVKDTTHEEQCIQFQSAEGKVGTTMGIGNPQTIAGTDGSEIFAEKVMVNRYIVALHTKRLQEWGILFTLIGNTSRAVTVTYNIGIKKKSQIITLSCTSTIELTAVSGRLRELLDQIDPTYRHKLLPLWHLQHREALMKSEPLAAAEKSTQATALFYINEVNQVYIIHAHSFKSSAPPV